MLKWEKPELTILSRGKPEERVLKGPSLNCKHPHTVGGPEFMNQGCDKGPPGCGACKANNGGS